MIAVATPGRRNGWLLSTAIAVAFLSAAARLIPLQFLHPLQWDELEFFRATRWIGEGRVPFRDFWEHHTPLAWFLFAPVARLVESNGVTAVIAMRWAQIPVWIATFWLANLWMKRRGVEPFARWAAIAFAVSSSFLMIAAVEYRVDSVGCLLVVAALVLAQRERYIWAGAMFCLAGFANLRLGPMLVIAVLALRLAYGARANRIFAGGIAALLVVLSYFAATGSLGAMWQQVIVDNRLGDDYATAVSWSLAHRLLSPFGIRVLATDRVFDPAGVDAGGIALLLFGVAGVALALRRWRDSREDGALAVMLLANLVFIGSMKFIYNYHFEIVAVLLVPLAAVAIARFRHTNAMAMMLCLALITALFASLLRGKELDRAYQDLVMRELHLRTRPSEKAWSGAAWGLGREPAYRFWFLPDLARQLVINGRAQPYAMSDPPAAIVLDHNALVWLAQVQRELVPYVARHYVPVWRELLVPAMNARILPGGRAEWVVLRSGTFRVYVSTDLARHPWFRDPIRTVAYKGPDAGRLTVVLDRSRQAQGVHLSVDGQPVLANESLTLQAGQKVSAESGADVPVAVLLISSDDGAIFRQPPPGVSMDAEMPRRTHWPDFRPRIEP